ncbi:hypothetical protein [Bradyrhizobium acaciae]|uniref:hypothetical protein n=1 Tax=Bradyrhizobium acaciae TaxID=2683706 RepID=UPI001E560FE8|nr:hypothetical protein [Bradyrhizobium acaciae]MCC8979915.1 hypothetical protein [Bradyrhizobium acaciae]
MSIILRIFFVIAGAIVALFVARDSLHFDLIQTWVSIVLVIIVAGIASFWARRRKA